MLIDALHLPKAAILTPPLHINRDVLRKEAGFKDDLLDALKTVGNKKHVFDVAVLNSQTAHLAPHTDAQRACSEVHVLEIACVAAKADEIEDALFAHIPYALVIITHVDDQSRLSLAKFRTSESDKSKNVITETLRSRWFVKDAPELADLTPAPANLDLWSYYCRLFDAVALDSARSIWPDFPDNPACAKLAADIQCQLALQIIELQRKIKQTHELRRQTEYADRIRAIKSTIATLPNLSLEELEDFSFNTQA